MQSEVITYSIITPSNTPLHLPKEFTPRASTRCTQHGLYICNKQFFLFFEQKWQTERQTGKCRQTKRNRL